MSNLTYYVGLDLDLADRRFAASIVTASWKPLAGPAHFDDSVDGYARLVAWLDSYHCAPSATVLCMEATGFAGEPLAYYLVAHGYPVAVEPLVKVRRAFPSLKRKNGLNSQHVAEYAFRASNALRIWQPPIEMLDQIKLLLARKGRRMETLDRELRDLLTPQPAMVDEWPCY